MVWARIEKRRRIRRQEGDGDGGLVLSCTILCSTAFCRLSNDSQRRITQRIDDVDGAAYRLHGQKLAGTFNREWNNVGETASAAAAGNRFHSGMVRGKEGEEDQRGGGWIPSGTTYISSSVFIGHSPVDRSYKSCLNF